ncbi:glycoside hydrolase family 53 protein [Vibrio gangliei]|uniref:glycoside hydrolase family 53 protein n=1 Tax=Vibrio gangliei TaxID=2077090 RepID=UPI000D0218C6|nr:glycosyl hydrolase 53 family protein [Vibrio gangliei]
MQNLKVLALASAISIGLVTGCGSTTSTNTENTTETAQIIPAEVSSEFIKGVDLSMVPEVEALGGKYYDNGIAQDPVRILKDHGVNYVRMRIWVDPQTLDGKPYGGGNVTLERAIEMGKRAHENGIKYLLDIHYSDFWTDPGKQVKPKAWAKLSFDDLVKQVGEYTDQVMLAHKDAGVMPDMVQVGNELNSGMLWPDGKSWGGDGHEFERLSKLLNAGIHSVRSSYAHPSDVKIMLHLAEAGKNETFRWWFDEIEKNGVTDFDVIGMSYYPYWHGPMADVKSNMLDVEQRYNKPIVIVETSYAYTTKNGDELENSYTGEAPFENYEVSVTGQAHFLKDLMEMVNAVPNNETGGIFYWDPAWLPVKGATWATKAGMDYADDQWKPGNSWDNQLLFDFNGNVLPSVKVFEDK